MVTNDLPLRDGDLEVSRDEENRKRPNVVNGDGSEGTQPYGTDGDSDGVDGQDSDGTDGHYADGTDGDSDGTDGDSDGSDA